MIKNKQVSHPFSFDMRDYVEQQRGELVVFIWQSKSTLPQDLPLFKTSNFQLCCLFLSPGDFPVGLLEVEKEHKYQPFQFSLSNVSRYFSQVEKYDKTLSEKYTLENKKY